MAFWRIPLLCEDSPLDSVFDDIFDNTCPRKRYRLLYHPYLNDKKIRDRKMGQRSLKGKRTDGKRKDGSFKVTMNVEDYDPNDIALKVNGDKLLINGKREKKNNHGYESCEFERAYTIPNDVDVESLKSRINDDGLLEIEAPKKKQEAIQDTDQAVQQDENKFKAVFDVTQYKPDEVSVKVQGRQVIVHGEQKSECKEDDEEMFVHDRQFTRRFVLPETVELDSLQSKWTKDGKLVIEAEKCASIEAEARQLEIEHEAEEEKKDE